MTHFLDNSCELILTVFYYQCNSVGSGVNMHKLNFRNHKTFLLKVGFIYLCFYICISMYLQKNTSYNVTYCIIYLVGFVLVFFQFIFLSVVQENWEVFLLFASWSPMLNRESMYFMQYFLKIFLILWTIYFIHSVYQFYQESMWKHFTF